MKRLLLALLIASSPAFATLNDTSNGRRTATGDGVALVYTFTFPAVTSGDLAVSVVLNGVLQAIGFTVALNSDQIVSPGGSITFNSAPPSTSVVTIQRQESLVQLTSLPAWSPFPAKTVERSLDSIVRKVQQVDRRIADQEQKEIKDISSTIAGGSAAASLLAPTATGATTPVTLADRFGQKKTIKDFGAVCDNSADDTTAIQSAITSACASGQNVELPAPAVGSACKFTTLTFPQGNGKTCGLIGVGPGDDFSAITPASYSRTTLVSTNATGPAITITGGAGVTARQLVLQGFTLIVSNTTQAISLTGANTGTVLKDLLIEQDGAGGCVDWTDVWSNAGIENVLCQSGAAVLTSGSVGVRVRNNALDGGGFFARRLMVQRKFSGLGGFDFGIQFGALVGQTQNKNIDAIRCENCISQSNNTGIIFGNGVKSVDISASHTEFNATCGMRITNNAHGFDIHGNFFYNRTATQADLCVDGDGTSAAQYAINVHGNSFESVFNYGIDLVNAGFTSGIISGNYFARFGAGTGIAIRTRSNATPWAVLNNTFASMAGNFDDSSVVAVISDTLGNLTSKATVQAKGVTVGTDGLNVNSSAATINSAGRVAGTTFFGIGQTFAGLGTPGNGTFSYCTDCTVANPCAGGGTGAIAKRLNGAWVCN